MLQVVKASVPGGQAEAHPTSQERQRQAGGLALAQGTKASRDLAEQHVLLRADGLTGGPKGLRVLPDHLASASRQSRERHAYGEPLADRVTPRSVPAPFATASARLGEDAAGPVRVKRSTTSPPIQGAVKARTAPP